MRYSSLSGEPGALSGGVGGISGLDQSQLTRGGIAALVGSGGLDRIPLPSGATHGA